MREQVGAIFRNIRRGEGICEVCTGPASTGLCNPCGWHRRNYGARLSDLVVPLAYAERGQQSGHHMYGYKSMSGPSEEIRRDLKLLVLAGSYLHRRCVAAVVGGPWSTVTFVPSAKRPGMDHPVLQLADQTLLQSDTHIAKVVLELGPDISVERNAGPLPGRYAVPEHLRGHVENRHVLLVDDTWVSGAKSQSAAITLMDAGASAVTTMCVARWLDRQYGGHPELLDSVTGLYDALRCPVTGGPCPL